MGKLFVVVAYIKVPVPGGPYYLILYDMKSVTLAADHDQRSNTHGSFGGQLRVAQY